jgi:phage gp36-like protein
MTEPLLYTNSDAIMRRLTGRLEQYGVTAMGRTPIDIEFLNQVAEQAEARLTNVLRSLYKLPLKAVHPTLAEYVELRCVCQIIPVYFQRQNVSDDRGLGEIACTESATLLMDLELGKIRLDGETTAAQQPAIFAQAQTIVRRRNPGVAEGIRF